MSDSENEDPKIIVDTDWKDQVEKEREQANEPEKEPDFVPKEHTKPETSEPAAVDTSDTPPPPEASFEVLVTMLFTQAMATLGQIPNPSTGEAEVNKPFAKHYIDTLELLDEKTKGNLTDEESKILSEALHALRMMYVNTKST